jgi:hypothetical protein
MIANACEGQRCVRLADASEFGGGGGGGTLNQILINGTLASGDNLLTLSTPISGLLELLCSEGLEIRSPDSTTLACGIAPALNIIGVTSTGITLGLSGGAGVIQMNQTTSDFDLDLFQTVELSSVNDFSITSSAGDLITTAHGIIQLNTPPGAGGNVEVISDNFTLNVPVGGVTSGGEIGFTGTLAAAIAAGCDVQNGIVTITP